MNHLKNPYLALSSRIRLYPIRYTEVRFRSVSLIMYFDAKGKRSDERDSPIWTNMTRPGLVTRQGADRGDFAPENGIEGTSSDREKESRNDHMFWKSFPAEEVSLAHLVKTSAITVHPSRTYKGTGNYHVSPLRVERFCEVTEHHNPIIARIGYGRVDATGCSLPEQTSLNNSASRFAIFQ